MHKRTPGRTASIRARRWWLVMPPPGTQCAPIWQPASNAVQKPRNGPNENANSTRSPGWTRRRREHRLPAVERPLPAGVGVEPAQRTPGRRRGLVIARVGLDRLGVRAAPGRVRVLVGDQLRLRRERQAARRRRRRRRGAGVDARAGELARVERVARRPALSISAAQPRRLPRGQGGRVADGQAAAALMRRADGRAPRSVPGSATARMVWSAARSTQTIVMPPSATTLAAALDAAGIASGCAS